VILRALYDAVPFLRALGLASISAYTLLTAARMSYVTNLRYSRYQLTANGRSTGAGRAFLAAAGVWTLFLAHSAVVQYDTIVGARRHEAGQAGGLELLLRAETHGLFPSAALEERIAAAFRARGDDAAAETHDRRAVEIDDGLPGAHLALARYARTRGDKATAIEEFRKVVRDAPELEGADGDLAALLLEDGRGAEALALSNGLIARRPNVAAFRLTRALVLAQTGDIPGALRETQQVADAHPDLAEAPYQLGRLLASQSRLDEALAALERATQLAPGSVEMQSWCAKAALAQSNWPVAREHLEAAMRVEPENGAIVAAWATLLRRSGGLDAAIARAEGSPVQDRANRFARMHLYRAAGRDADADALAAEFVGTAR
jgi:tetratricopeptide (TPR) repeat protein